MGRELHLFLSGEPFRNFEFAVHVPQIALSADSRLSHSTVATVGVGCRGGVDKSVKRAQYLLAGRQAFAPAKASGRGARLARAIALGAVRAPVLVQ